MYRIVGFHSDDSRNVIVTFSCKGKENIDINLTTEFPDYCGVNDKHYIVNGGLEIVIIKPPANSRAVIVDANNVYTRATQYQLDRFEFIHFNTDNGRMYKRLLNNFNGDTIIR